MPPLSLVRSKREKPPRSLGLSTLKKSGMALERVLVEEEPEWGRLSDGGERGGR